MNRIRRASAVAAVASLALFGAACSDEDDDGAETDEELEQLDESGEDVGNDLEEELNEGEEELRD